jgi:YidC/Oxa1 family membrane protein insertase
LPVFLALLHVLRYFNRPGLSFEQNAAIPNYVFGPDQVRSFLQARLFGAPLSSYITMPQSLLDSFGTHVDRWEVVAVAVPLLLLAAVATHITARFSLRQQQVGQVALEAGSQAAQVAAFMRWTPWIFPLGAIVGGLFFPFPIAILLYWLTNSAWTMAQQHLVHRAMATEAAQITAQAPARAETAPRPGQKPTLPPGATPLAASASGAPVAGADHECSDPGTPQPGTPQPGDAQRGRKATASRKRAGARKGDRH